MTITINKQGDNRMPTNALDLFIGDVGELWELIEHYTQEERDILTEDVIMVGESGRTYVQILWRF
jgi:hypothetical protein